MSDDVRRKVETSLRAAADAVREAQCALTSVAEGEHVVYGTRSKLCMALGLDVNASGIAIVDAARAVIRERDEARALVAAAGAVISEIGCECACVCDEDHDDDCEGPCSVCRIADALQPRRGAR